jgi:4-hydroxybenzoate polyprenyltransferase
MKALFHFILSHSIFISFCAAALALQTLLLLSHPINIYLLAFIFFATLSGYNAYWISSKVFFNRYPSFSSFVKGNGSSLIVIAIALIGMVVCFDHLHLVMYNIITTLVFLCLYAVPLIPLRQLQFTRKAGFVKTILLALAWTMATTLIPLQIPITEMQSPALLIFVMRFLFMLMLCIIFDKRDAAIDKIRGLQSLATDMRPALLNFLIGIVLLAYVLTTCLLHYYGIDTLNIIMLIVMAAFTLWAYVSSFKRTDYIFYYFIVDGLMFLSGLLTVLVSI